MEFFLFKQKYLKNPNSKENLQFLKEKKKRIILEDFHTLNTKGLYTARHRVLFIIISDTKDRTLFRIDGQHRKARREVHGQ